MNEWFKDWFSSDEYLSVYQHRNDEDARKLLNLILTESGPADKGTILDAACGAGRHSINLALKGFRVTGFDLSKTLLKIARREAENRKLKIDFFCADLRNVRINKKFDLIINLFTSFGYFRTDEENFRFINTAYTLLKNDCYYILDFLNSEYVKENLVPESVNVTGGKRITERRKIVSGRVEKEIIIEDENSAGNYIESVQLYSGEKIIDEFGKIGFNFVKAYGDYNGSKFLLKDSQRLILFFKK